MSCSSEVRTFSTRSRAWAKIVVETDRSCVKGVSSGSWETLWLVGAFVNEDLGELWTMEDITVERQGKLSRSTKKDGTKWLYLWAVDDGGRLPRLSAVRHRAEIRFYDGRIRYYVQDEEIRCSFSTIANSSKNENKPSALKARVSSPRALPPPDPMKETARVRDRKSINPRQPSSSLW